MGRNDKHGSNTVDFGTASDLKFRDTKQRVFSAAGRGWNWGSWHSRLGRYQNLIWAISKAPTSVCLITHVGSISARVGGRLPRKRTCRYRSGRWVTRRRYVLIEAQPASIDIKVKTRFSLAI